VFFIGPDFWLIATFVDHGTINGAMIWQLVQCTCNVYIDFEWRFL